MLPSVMGRDRCQLPFSLLPSPGYGLQLCTPLSLCHWAQGEYFANRDSHLSPLLGCPWKFWVPTSTQVCQESDLEIKVQRTINHMSANEVIPLRGPCADTHLLSHSPSRHDQRTVLVLGRQTGQRESCQSQVCAGN